MFEWLNSQAVRSDLGFEVESIDRSSIQYREGCVSLNIEVENGFVDSKPCIIFDKQQFEVVDGEMVPIVERDRMIKNFVDAMDFQGLAVVINE